MGVRANSVDGVSGVSTLDDAVSENEPVDNSKFGGAKSVLIAKSASPAKTCVSPSRLPLLVTSKTLLGVRLRYVVVSASNSGIAADVPEILMIGVVLVCGLPDRCATGDAQPVTKNEMHSSTNEICLESLRDISIKISWPIRIMVMQEAKVDLSFQHPIRGESGKLILGKEANFAHFHIGSCFTALQFAQVK